MDMLDLLPLQTHETELTEQEVAYCVNDVRVVMAYIQEKIENERGLANLPITKTGYVRQFCKRIVFIFLTHIKKI